MNPIGDFYRSDLRTGLKIVFTCLVVGILSATPLWLVSTFGPEDTTPTALALVAMFGTIFAGLGAVIGTVWLIIELIFIRK